MIHLHIQKIIGKRVPNIRKIKFSVDKCKSNNRLGRVVHTLKCKMKPMQMFDGKTLMWDEVVIQENELMKNNKYKEIGFYDSHGRLLIKYSLEYPLTITNEKLTLTPNFVLNSLKDLGITI